MQRSSVNQGMSPTLTTPIIMIMLAQKFNRMLQWPRSKTRCMSAHSINEASHYVYDLGKHYNMAAGLLNTQSQKTRVRVSMRQRYGSGRKKSKSLRPDRNY